MTRPSQALWWAKPLGWEKASLALAQAHTLLVRGCTSAPVAPRLVLDGRPMPWVLGLGGSALIVSEPWSQLRALHRRKRGFSAATGRLQSVIEAARQTGTDLPLRVEVWQDAAGQVPDARLLEMMGQQIAQDIEVFGPPGLRAAIAAVEEAAGAQHVGHANPLIAVLAWRKSLLDAEPSG